MVNGYITIFPSLVMKGDNFYDSLFASPDNEEFLKKR